MKNLVSTVLASGLCLVVGWSLGIRSSASRSQGGERQVLFYQSPMHPWVKSPTPGDCTVCGMDLVPVYSGTELDVTAETVHMTSNNVWVAGVETVVATNRMLQRTVRVAGKIMENTTETKRLSAYIGGRIEKLFVNFEGAVVEKGELLATVYSPILREAEREYVLLYRQSQMNHSTKITAEHGRLLVAMRHRLIQYGLAEKQIDALPNKPDRVSTSDIYSPMDGIVSVQKVIEGQYVTEGDLLFEIVDFYNLWFQFDVYEDVLESVKEGQAIEIGVPGKNGFRVSSSISFINPNLNYESRSAEVRAELRNPTLRIRGVKHRAFKRDMYAEGRISLTLGSMNSVPRTSVLNDGVGGSYVFVATAPDAFEKRRVKVVARGDLYWGIANGLSPGDRVVASGAVLLDSEVRL